MSRALAQAWTRELRDWRWERYSSRVTGRVLAEETVGSAAACAAMRACGNASDAAKNAHARADRALMRSPPEQRRFSSRFSGPRSTCADDSGSSEGWRV